MTHKNNLTAATPFLGLLVRLPWWVGVCLALVAFVVLDRLDEPPASASARLLGSVGQVLVPLLCLLAAAVSAWRRRMAMEAWHPTVVPDTPEPLYTPAQPDFEDTVPPCPLCNGAMERRIARGGADDGKVFWRCCSHPVCLGRREVE
jgi:restriction system protein